MSDPRVAPFATYFRRLDDLGKKAEDCVEALAASLRADEGSGLEGPSTTTERLRREAADVHDKYCEVLEDLQRATGLPEELFEAIERAEDERFDDRYWLKEVLQTEPTGDLDSTAQRGLEELRRIINPRDLAEEAGRGYRLDDSFLREPLTIVSNVRIAPPGARAQRFARMLLVTDDHLNKQAWLDIFEAPTLTAEVAAIGTRVNEIRELGPEAERKLRHLPRMTDDEVASTVYELLVGTAAIRKGLSVEMIPSHGSTRTPDLRLHHTGVPSSIECKRRLGLTLYELGEAHHAQLLYRQIRPGLVDTHKSVSAWFEREMTDVPPSEFEAAVLPLITDGTESQQAKCAWGAVAVETLPHMIDFRLTRTYAPDFLTTVFGWNPEQEEWDGLICEVDPSRSILTTKVRNPRCLRWVSRSATATLKKSRGITSLWGRAVKQIPAGDMGFIYLAYPEGNRAAIADERTREIMNACQRWKHRWSVRIGATVVNRFYPRSLSVGMPDFIESAIPIVESDHAHFMRMLPKCVLVRPPANERA